MSNGFMDKFKNFLGVEVEDELLEDDEFETSREHEYKQQDTQSHVFPATTKNKVVNIHNNANIKIEVYQPKSFDEALEIVECLRSKRPVVVNLESNNPELARKIFDFLSGALCAIDGKAEKISKGIFLMAPNNVQIKGAIEDKEYPKDDAEKMMFSFEE